MKMIILTVILSLLSVNALAKKLDDCFECSVKKYTDSDIQKNKLFEIALLRNEILARHHYSFENGRIGNYFSQFSWYQPKAKEHNNTIDLNSFEKENIQLFKQREKIIKKDRQLLINELMSFKAAIKNNDAEMIQSVFSDVLQDTDPDYVAIIESLDKVFNVLNLKDINWHKGKALYKVSIDNGFSILSNSIRIEGNVITIVLIDPMGHSTLLDDSAFNYPSEYESESEYAVTIELEFKKGKLILINTFFVG